MSSETIFLSHIPLTSWSNRDNVNESMRKLLQFILLTGVCVSSCLAEGVAAYPIGGSVGADPRAFTIGWEFSVSTRITVSALAFLDVTGHGLNVPHTVGIFASGGGAPLVSAVVPAGAGVRFQNGFRVVPVNYVLTPGTYVMAGQSPSDADPVIVRASSVSVKSQISYIEEREAESGTFTFPAKNLPQVESGDFGPSFLFSEDTQTNAITALANSASNQPGFAPGTYVSVYGAGLSNTTRVWTAADFANGNALPTSLDGVSATVNGVSAYINTSAPARSISLPRISAHRRQACPSC